MIKHIHFMTEADLESVTTAAEVLSGIGIGRFPEPEQKALLHDYESVCTAIERAKADHKTAAALDLYVFDAAPFVAADITVGEFSILQKVGIIKP